MKHNRRSERVVFRQIERAQIEHRRPSARGRFETKKAKFKQPTAAASGVCVRLNYY